MKVDILNKLFIRIGLAIAGLLLVILLVSMGFKIFGTNQPEPENTESVQSDASNEVIQINILNSTSKSGIADIARNYMRNAKFDVVEIGNYTELQARSTVLDRVGDFASALKVARAMGIADSLVFTKKDSTLFLKATIILGNDYNKLKSFH